MVVWQSHGQSVIWPVSLSVSSVRRPLVSVSTSCTSGTRAEDCSRSSSAKNSNRDRAPMAISKSHTLHACPLTWCSSVIEEALADSHSLTQTNPNDNVTVWPEIHSQRGHIRGYDKGSCLLFGDAADI